MRQYCLYFALHVCKVVFGVIITQRPLEILKKFNYFLQGTQVQGYDATK